MVFGLRKGAIARDFLWFMGVIPSCGADQDKMSGAPTNCCSVQHSFASSGPGSNSKLGLGSIKSRTQHSGAAGMYEAHEGVSFLGEPPGIASVILWFPLTV